MDRLFIMISCFVFETLISNPYTYMYTWNIKGLAGLQNVY